MKVCIAEKPSVARDIASVLGASSRKDGYYEGNGYQVTWTFGHFCTLKEPHDYRESWKYWQLEDLPIIPSSFGIKLIENSGVKKQFGIIEKLVQNCDEIINCGDAGQEGELIQRWVLLKARATAPVKRLWISSLTEDAIKEGFEKLKDSKDYENLYAAGSARAIGDWLLGINATRVFTKKFGRQRAVLSIGRVQTPTLAMLVQRQKEIDAFKVEIYFELKTIYRETEFVSTINRLKTLEKAQQGLEYLKQREFEITSFEIKEGKEGSPRLFDLTSLQVEANKKFGFSAEETLKYVQSLYEKKVVTYPRVDTTYLSEDLHPKIPGIFQRMKPYSRFTAPLLEEPLPKSKGIFNDEKVTDHHAIIPTGVSPEGVTFIKEKQTYDLIARRFLAAFYPDCIVSNTTVLAQVGEVPFKATGKQILNPGWRVVYGNDKSKDKEQDNLMPVFEEGETGPHEPFIHEGKTSPPKPYTEATLLRAMETAGKQVDDEEMRELMKDNGIGRPSTRANIIETLLRRQYIRKKRKNLIATQTGIELIDTIGNELLKSAELTGDWERKLRLIEKGQYEPETFKKELIAMVREVTDEVIFSQRRAITIEDPEEAKKKKRASTSASGKAVAKKVNLEESVCPKCGKEKLIKGKTAYGCSAYNTCRFVIPFEIFGKKLSAKQISDLVSKKKTSKLKGFIIADKPDVTEGVLRLNDKFEVELG